MKPNQQNRPRKQYNCGALDWWFGEAETQTKKRLFSSFFFNFWQSAL
jgi:hypothetical protein